MEERHLKSALVILKGIRYITIATICEDGSPWNTPVSASFDTELNFFWGSSPENVHSQNIRRDVRVFVVIYDSTVPEGTGEALYMQGKADELEMIDDALTKYRFVPERVWVNDETKNEDGTYKHDIRVELNLNSLREGL